MLVPHALLWRGVSSRGPADQACTSNGTTNNLASIYCSRISRQRRAAVVRSYEPAAVLRLAPKQSDSSRVKDSSTNSAVGGDPGSSADGSGSSDRSVGNDSSGRQNAVGGKVLQINIDLMLWRSRTSRIRAKQTLDTAERKVLYKAAEDGLRRCVALDPSDPRAYVVLGKTLVQQKRYDEARALYQDGCANTGNTNPYIWSAWGWLEALTGNADRARKLYDAAVVVDNTHACAWHKWGMLEKGQGNYTRARDLWMQGIQRCRRKPQSQNAYLYNALGCMAAQLGRLGEARAWFEEGTRTAEGAASVALWQAWAVLEAKQGDPTAVRYLFRKALAANPRSRYVHLSWALWERKQGNGTQCLALLRRGAQLNPTDPALYQAWALVEKQAGRYDRARQLFEMGLKADPGYLYLWQAYGVMEAELGNLDRARQLFQEGVWADPRSIDTVYVFHAWGSLEARAGNYQTARELFKAAVRVDPKNETTWASWVAMESEQGFVERADELRIRQAEQQWEFVVPAGFTTRPAPGLMDTLTRFFSARGFGGTASGSGSAEAEGASGSRLGVRTEDEQLRQLVETGDFTALPDFVSPDDDIEAALRPPHAAAGSSDSGRGAPPPALPLSSPLRTCTSRPGSAPPYPASSQGGSALTLGRDGGPSPREESDLDDIPRRARMAAAVAAAAAAAGRRSSSSGQGGRDEGGGGEAPRLPPSALVWGDDMEGTGLAPRPVPVRRSSSPPPSSPSTERGDVMAPVGAGTGGGGDASSSLVNSD